MQFRLGNFPQSEAWQPNDQWTTTRWPNPLLLQLIATPFAFAVAGAVALTWQYFYGAIASMIYSPGKLLATDVAIILLLILPAHELLHALAFPHFGLTRRTTLGLWPSRFMAYAYHDGPLSRRHLLAVIAAPWLVLSLLPSLVAFCLPPSALIFVALLSIFNCFASGMDVLSFIWVMRRPSGCVLRVKGARTYWALRPEVAA